MTPGIGHNSGADLRGYTGRLHQWRRARRALLGNALPIEVVRLRVRRAAELGLDYKTYASVRAGTGRDIVALLFSSNALGLIRPGQPDPARIAKIARVDAGTGTLIHAPLPLEAPTDWVERAPSFAASPSALARDLRAALKARNLPADTVLMIGETAFEASWCPAIRAAGYVSGARYFAD